MVKQELIDRSPVRFFEKALNGGIKPGEIGVLASKKGVGKTSVLVQLGLDGLLQGKQVVHVSFDQHTSYTMTWYEDIFTEMSKKKKLEKAVDVKDDVIRNRTVLNFNQDSVSTKQIITTLSALAQGGIKTDYLIIDGLDFSKRTKADFESIKEYAKKENIIVWYSCNTEGTELKTVLPADLVPLFDAVVLFETKSDSTQLRILKVRDETPSNENLKLDSKTLLIAEK
jgi:archaellum biogenesis ATPase FlaH